MFFQTCMSVFLLWNTKDYILTNFNAIFVHTIKVNGAQNNIDWTPLIFIVWTKQKPRDIPTKTDAQHSRRHKIFKWRVPHLLLMQYLFPFVSSQQRGCQNYDYVLCDSIMSSCHVKCPLMEVCLPTRPSPTSKRHLKEEAMQEDLYGRFAQRHMLQKGCLSKSFASVQLCR